jgi:hypothetical protein
MLNSPRHIPKQAKRVDLRMQAPANYAFFSLCNPCERSHHTKCKAQCWQATHILCDPSCSGSGLVAQYHGVSGGVQTGESGAEEHDIGGNDLKALAAEQIKIVLAAMSLPKAQVKVNCTRAHTQCTVCVMAKTLCLAGLAEARYWTQGMSVDFGTFRRSWCTQHARSIAKRTRMLLLQLRKTSTGPAQLLEMAAANILLQQSRIIQR